MTYNTHLRCKQCGNSLKDGSRFCEACGAPVSGSHSTSYAGQSQAPKKPPVVRKPLEELGFPDISVPPVLGKGLSEGWAILTRDIWGGIITALLILFVGSMLYGIPIIGMMVYVALYAGHFAWADSVRREGKQMEVGVMVNTAVNNFTECFVPGVVMFLYGLIIAIPLIIAYFMIVIGLIGFGASAAAGSPAEALLMMPISAIIFMGFFLLLIFVTAPIIQSWMMITAWAIYRGARYADAMNWAWERIKAHAMMWWLTGFVMGLIAQVGVYAGYIGIVITYPWANASWLSVISNGEKFESTEPDAGAEPQTVTPL